MNARYSTLKKISSPFHAKRYSRHQIRRGPHSGRTVIVQELFGVKRAFGRNPLTKRVVVRQQGLKVTRIIAEDSAKVMASNTVVGPVRESVIESQAARDEENRILSLENFHVDRVNYIKNWYNTLKNNKTRFQKGTNKPETHQEIIDLVQRFLKFAAWLHNVVTMTKKLAADTHLKTYLELVINPQHKFPQGMAAGAKRVWDKFEAESWGANAEESSDEGEDLDEPQPSSSTTTRSRQSTRPSGSGLALGPPPADHPIFGLRGIMHGIAMKKNPKSYVRDIRFPARDYKIHGHNGQRVGKWYARQLVALFHGCHGASNAGISGSADMGGAFSVVVSGKGAYRDLDQDNGDVIYYSGSGSHDNENPEYPADQTRGTLALHKSIQTRQPVRVLRSAGGPHGAKYHPSVGMRYDGLYRVVECEYPRNNKGGMYERFVLRRLPDQTSLAELMATSPTPREVAHYGRITDGY